jgi:hypothetical protein
MGVGDLAVGHSGGVRDPRRARPAPSASFGTSVAFEFPSNVPAADARLHAGCALGGGLRPRPRAGMRAGRGSPTPTACRDARWARVSDPDRVPDR